MCRDAGTGRPRGRCNVPARSTIQADEPSLDKCTVRHNHAVTHRELSGHRQTAPTALQLSPTRGFASLHCRRRLFRFHRAIADQFCTRGPRRHKAERADLRSACAGGEPSSHPAHTHVHHGDTSADDSSIAPGSPLSCGKRKERCTEKRKTSARVDGRSFQADGTRVEQQSLPLRRAVGGVHNYTHA